MWAFVSRLDKVDISEVGMRLLEALNEIREGGLRVLHTHFWAKLHNEPREDLKNDSHQTLVGVPWAQTYSRLLCADGFHNSVDNFQPKPGTILNRATILIRALVGYILKELINQVSISTMYLNAIEPGTLDGVSCSGGIITDVILYLWKIAWVLARSHGEVMVHVHAFYRQGSRSFRLARELDIRRGYIRKVRILRCELLWYSCTTKSPQLTEDKRSFRVDNVSNLRWLWGQHDRSKKSAIPDKVLMISHVDKSNRNLTHAFPGGYLLIVVDSGSMGMPARFLADVRSLWNEQRPRCTRALRVVFHSKVTMNMSSVGSVSGEWCEHNTVGELDISDLDGLEELRYSSHFTEYSEYRDETENLNETMLMLHYHGLNIHF